MSLQFDRIHKSFGADNALRGVSFDVAEGEAHDTPAEDWPVFTKNALAGVDPAKTKVISFDTISPALDLLREGKVQVLLGQKYFGCGSESVRLLRDITHGKSPATAIIDSGVDVVTKENVDAYQQMWKKMAQNQVPGVHGAWCA